jgi:hypothetical protein
MNSFEELREHCEKIIKNPMISKEIKQEHILVLTLLDSNKALQERIYLLEF